MFRLHWRLPATALAGVLSLGMLAGCGSDDASSGTDSSSTSDSSSPSDDAASDSPTDGSSDDPGATDSPSPGVPPAAGKPVTIDPYVSLNLPQGWTLTDMGDTTTGSDRDGVSFLTVSNLGEDGVELSQEAQRYIRNNAFLKKPQIGDEVEIDGVEAFHVEGLVSSIDYLDAYGAVVDDQIIYLAFRNSTYVKPPEREQIIVSVLASVDFEG